MNRGQKLLSREPNQLFFVYVWPFYWNMGLSNNNGSRSKVHKIFIFKVHRTGFKNTDKTRIKNRDPVECIFFFFFFHWNYSPMWALACRTMSFHFFLSAISYLHLLTPSTGRSLSTSSFHLFLGLPLLLVPSSSWVKIFSGILSSSILSRWPNQLILCTFIHFKRVHHFKIISYYFCE